MSEQINAVSLELLNQKAQGNVPLLPEQMYVDNAVKVARQNNEDLKIQTILGIWSKQHELERDQRGKYADWFKWVLVIQLIAINIAFFLIGRGCLYFDQWTVNIFIVSVFGEIMGIVLIIVKYLFTSTSKEMIELIKEQK